MTVAATWMRIARVKITANVLRRFVVEAFEGAEFRTVETRIAEKAGLKLPTWSMKLERCSLMGAAMGARNHAAHEIKNVKKKNDMMG